MLKSYLNPLRKVTMVFVRIYLNRRNRKEIKSQNTYQIACQKSMLIFQIFQITSQVITLLPITYSICFIIKALYCVNDTRQSKYIFQDVSPLWMKYMTRSNLQYQKFVLFWSLLNMIRCRKNNLIIFVRRKNCFASISKCCLNSTIAISQF